MPLPSPESEAARVEALYREAKSSGDQQQLTQAAEECARAYGALGEAAKEREYLHLLGKHQILAGSYSACLQTVERMFNSPGIHGEPAAQARALILRAAALRNQDHHAPAIENARLALTTLQGIGGSHRIRAEACQALIASLVEAGSIDEAWDLRNQLSDSLAEITDSRLSGQGYWTLGNLAFAHGQLDEGSNYHAKAAGFLRHSTDVRIWARFNKASADVRLQAGVADEQTRECIERAKLAYEIIGGSPAELTDLAVTRAKWNRSTGKLVEASAIMGTALGVTGTSSTLESAAAHMLWAEILDDLGSPGEAEDQRRRAKTIRDNVDDIG